LICGRQITGYLCQEHNKEYILDTDNQWLRRKKRLQSGVRKRVDMKTFNTEKKLLTILNLVYGKNNIETSVHPLWAFSPKNVLMEYDICVKSHHILFEYNGLQHYEYPNFFHKNKDEFKNQVIRDKLKKKLAIDNGWNFEVFKYDEKVTYGSVYSRLSSSKLI